jgi:hypothetical protein
MKTAEIINIPDHYDYLSAVADFESKESKRLESIDSVADLLNRRSKLMHAITELKENPYGRPPEVIKKEIESLVRLVSIAKTRIEIAQNFIADPTAIDIKAVSIEEEPSSEINEDPPWIDREDNIRLESTAAKVRPSIAPAIPEVIVLEGNPVEPKVTGFERLGKFFSGLGAMRKTTKGNRSTPTWTRGGSEKKSKQWKNGLQGLTGAIAIIGGVGVCGINFFNIDNSTQIIQQSSPIQVANESSIGSLDRTTIDVQTSGQAGINDRLNKLDQSLQNTNKLPQPTLPTKKVKSNNNTSIQSIPSSKGMDLVEPVSDLVTLEKSNFLPKTKTAVKTKESVQKKLPIKPSVPVTELKPKTTISLASIRKEAQSVADARERRINAILKEQAEINARLNSEFSIPTELPKLQTKSSNSQSGIFDGTPAQY